MVVEILSHNQLIDWYRWDIEERSNLEEKAKVVGADWRTEWFQFLAALAILHQEDLKKRMNIITATWRNGCIEKMDDLPLHTTPNHHPPKVVALPKPFLQFNLAA